MAQPKKSSSKAHTIDFDSHDARRHLDQLKNYPETVQQNLTLNGNQLEASLNTLTAVKRFADAFLKLEMKSALTDPLMTLAVELKHISMVGCQAPSFKLLKAIAMEAAPQNLCQHHSYMQLARSVWK